MASTWQGDHKISMIESIKSIHLNNDKWPVPGKVTKDTLKITCIENDISVMKICFTNYSNEFLQID